MAAAGRLPYGMGKRPTDSMIKEASEVPVSILSEFQMPPLFVQEG